MSAVDKNTTPVHTPWPGLIEAYRSRLPIGDGWKTVTLREGGTPLLPAERLSELTGCEVHIKVEGLNPTGSFKDRGMTMAVTEALASGKQAVLCASTGNTSASAAAYAAKAGIGCAVLVPQGKIAMGKLAQAVMHGAKIVQVEGNFDDCLELARKTTSEFETIGLVNSVNLCASKARRPRRSRSSTHSATHPTCMCCPSQRRQHHRVLEGLLRVLRRRAEHTSAAHARRPGGRRCPARPRPSGQQPRDDRHRDPDRAPASWNGAVAAKEESNGAFRAATDEEILEAYRLLAKTESIFVEPASAASIAGLLAARKEGWLEPGLKIVCTVTGNGLKDPDTALRDVPVVEPIQVDPVAVASALELV